MEKGTTNNPNGRPKGVPNRITSTVREVLGGVIATELDKVPQLLKVLPAKERLDAIIRLLPYVVPRMGAIVSSSDSADTATSLDDCAAKIDTLLTVRGGASRPASDASITQE
jgi:hypothetical protein